MPKKPSPELKVTLDRKSTSIVREQAKKNLSTPPRFIAKIISEWAEANAK